MFKTALTAIAASGLSLFSFTMDAETTDAAAQPIDQNDLQFHMIDVDALLYAPVVDEMNKSIGHVDEIMVAGNGQISGFIISEYEFLPIFSEARQVPTGNVDVLRQPGQAFLVRVKG